MRTRYTPLRGDAPHPWETRTTTWARRAASLRLGGTMKRFDRRLHIRVGQADTERAQTLDITTSSLVRLLLQLLAEDVAARSRVVLDLVCANLLCRELNQ